MSESEINAIFAKNLRKYMDSLNMSQGELAKKLDVTQACIWSWCSGQKAPRMNKLDALCRIFSCNRSDLLEEHDEAYYTNAETARIAQELFDDPNLRVLFDAARDLSPEQMEQAARILKALKGGE